MERFRDRRAQHYRGIAYFPITLAVSLPQLSRTVPGGGIYSSAPSINSRGSIAGSYYNYDLTQMGIYRYDSNSGAMVDLGNFGLNQIRATSINDQGDIAGFYYAGADPKTGGSRFLPFEVSASGQLTLIPTLGGRRSHHRQCDSCIPVSRGSDFGH